VKAPFTAEDVPAAREVGYAEGILAERASQAIKTTEVLSHLQAALVQALFKIRRQLFVPQLLGEDGGAYVAAWVWIGNDEVDGLCSECGGLANEGEGEGKGGYDGKCRSCADKAEAQRPS
jgi:hypothetical protein